MQNFHQAEEKSESTMDYRDVGRRGPWGTCGPQFENSLYIAPLFYFPTLNHLICESLPPPLFETFWHPCTRSKKRRSFVRLGESGGAILQWRFLTHFQYYWPLRTLKKVMNLILRMHYLTKIRIFYCESSKC